MDLLARVRQTLLRYDLAGRETRVVVALSGGPDSVALAYVVRRLSEEGELHAAGFAHFNHHLRPAADTDEQFCRELARTFGWPIQVGGADVAARARVERRSLEDAARTARHAFLERARRVLEADVVALGHTRDDQAETFLLRLLRGAGARGLAGMHPRRAAVIRPLIGCRRREICEYLDSLGARSVHDESNDDASIPRNRVRRELVPFLEQRFNPSIVDVLADEAEIAREEWHWMEGEAEVLAARISRGDCRSEEVRLDTDALVAAPRALARLVLRRAMTERTDGRAVAFKHVEQALHLCRSAAATVEGPGHLLQRFGRELVITCRAGRGRSNSPQTSEHFAIPLAVPGTVELPGTGWMVSAEQAASVEAGGVELSQSSVAVVQRAPCHGQLMVRNRRAGDRFRPLGLGGRKKLQDFFVDHKIARADRDRVPLVVDEFDRIVWVAGHTIAEEFRVTDPAQAVLILRLKVLGGSA